MEHLFNLSNFNVNHMNSELSDNLKSKISGFQHKGQVLKVHVSSQLTPEEYQELKTAVAAHDGSVESPLRIFQFISADMNPKITDFSIVGLTKNTPAQHAGKKTIAQYTSPIDETLVVQKEFIDVLSDTGDLIELHIKFEWFREDGTVGLSDTNLVRKFSPTDAEEEYEKRRRRQVRFMKASAKSKPGYAAFVDLIFSRYHAEIESFKDPGTDDWKNAMINETVTMYRQILDTVFDEETGATVQQALIAEIDMKYV